MNARLGHLTKNEPTAGQRSRRESPCYSFVNFLCPCGASKRVGDSNRLLMVAALVTGCNFTDFSKTSTAEPACLNPSVMSGAGVSPVAHWTFNGDVDAGLWLLDDSNGHPLVANADDGADAGAATPAKYPHINGEGQSLSLDGHQFVRSDPVAADHFDDLYLGSQFNEFTLAAWISVPARVFTSDGPAPFTWPILSTLGDDNHCRGYQLDIHFDGSLSSPELELSHQTKGLNDAGLDECMTLSLRAPLDVPSWATGTGRWHHVAGTLSQVGNGPQLALYWDGKLIQLQDPLMSPAPVPNDLPGVEQALYIGASAPNAASAAQTKFNGYIDDIAIFNQPLTEQQLADFVLATTTRPGPSNCRWRASEQWDTTASSPSFAQWSGASSPDSLTVNINDHDWGAGALDARLVPPRDLQLYDKAYLNADVPTGQAFQFTLASGDNSCTWVYLGTGPNRYTIDLTQPTNCVSSTCEVDFHRVDRASVTSEWAIPNDDSLERTQGKQSFIVRGLEFSPANGALPDWSAYGGVIGPLGYCWRLQAYEPDTSAMWNQGSVLWSSSVSAILTGPTYSGTRLVADYGERPLDILNCKSIALEATLDRTSGSTSSYAFVIQDVYGSWRSYNLSQDPNVSVYNVGDLSISSSSSDNSSQTKTTSNFDGFPKALDFRKVRLLGIQKPWGSNGPRSAYNATVKGLQFFDGINGTGAPNCERAGVN